MYKQRWGLAVRVIKMAKNMDTQWFVSFQTIRSFKITTHQPPILLLLPLLRSYRTPTPYLLLLCTSSSFLWFSSLQWQRIPHQVCQTSYNCLYIDAVHDLFCFYQDFKSFYFVYFYFILFFWRFHFCPGWIWFSQLKDCFFLLFYYSMLMFDIILCWKIKKDAFCAVWITCKNFS